MCLLCAGALFVACGSKRGKTVEVAEQADTVHVVGGDKDKHGCIASAGYTWSEVTERLYPSVGKRSPYEAVDDAEKMLFLVLSPDSTKWNCSFRKKKCRMRFWSGRGPSWRGDMFGMWKMMIQRMCVWKMEDGR